MGSRQNSKSTEASMQDAEEDSQDNTMYWVAAGVAAIAIGAAVAYKFKQSS